MPCLNVVLFAVRLDREVTVRELLLKLVETDRALEKGIEVRQEIGILLEESIGVCKEIRVQVNLLLLLWLRYPAAAAAVAEGR